MTVQVKAACLRELWADSTTDISTEQQVGLHPQSMYTLGFIACGLRRPTCTGRLITKAVSSFLAMASQSTLTPDVRTCGVPCSKGRAIDLGAHASTSEI